MAVKAGTAFVDIEGDFSALNKQMSSHFKKMDTQAAGAGKGIGRKLGAGIATGVAWCGEGRCCRSWPVDGRGDQGDEGLVGTSGHRAPLERCDQVHWRCSQRHCQAC